MDCMDRCVKQCDDAILPDLVPRLIEMMKKGIGPGTKAGCARVASMLAHECRTSLGPYTAKLLKALLNASTVRSAPLRRDFVNALGDVLRCAPQVSDFLSIWK